MLQFTESKVSALLAEVGWGTQKLRIRLSWGYYRTLLQADVVGLTLRSSNIGSLGFQHHAIANGANRPTLMRKPSPPLGITQDSMSNISTTFSAYVEDIISNDLGGYVSSGAYDEDDSQFSKRLLWAICLFYQRGLQAEEEVSPGQRFCVGKLLMTCSVRYSRRQSRCTLRALSSNEVSFSTQPPLSRFRRIFSNLIQHALPHALRKDKSNLRFSPFKENESWRY